MRADRRPFRGRRPGKTEVKDRKIGEENVVARIKYAYVETGLTEGC
jgi:hypothetical protein